ncbi:hypothetical protein [Halomarina rubra]|uniref:Ig-like domain-containing protein n=1 Tax=Halomarina rubra TaxID=2071873 RepID=A0ABD6AW00_9EURY|nr:hypothetical protein [Halomarina rubra]
MNRSATTLAVTAMLLVSSVLVAGGFGGVAAAAIVEPTEVDAPSPPESICAAEGLELRGKIDGGDLATQSEFTLDDGTELTVTDRYFKDDTEIVGIDFTSTATVGLVSVKGGQGSATNVYDYTGQAGGGVLGDTELYTAFNDRGVRAGISNVVFCGPSEDVTPTPDPVTVESTCTAEGGVLTVTNENDVAVDVTVNGPDEFEQTATLGAGENVSYDALADGAYTVTTSDDGVVVGEETLTLDCEEETPDPVAVTYRCTALGGELTVANDEDVAVAVTVNGPDEFEQVLTVEANSQQSLSDLTDGQYTVTSRTLAGDLLGQESVTFDCFEDPTPEPVSVTQSCVGADGLFAIANDNAVAVNVTVTGPEGFDETRTVAPGDDVLFVNLADGAYTVTTSVAGQQVGEEMLTVDCDEETPGAVSVLSQCTDMGGEFTVTNANDVAVNVTIDGPTISDQQVTLGAGEEWVVPDLADGEYTVTTSYRGQTVDERTVTVDCVEESYDPVSVTYECTAEGGAGTITNTNDVAVRVTVDGPDGYSVDRTLAPGQTISGSGLVDGEYTVTTSVDGEQVSQQTVVLDCVEAGDEAYQFDLAFGPVIEDLGDSPDAFYGTQERLMHAASFTSDGAGTGAHNVPDPGETARAASGSCDVRYSAIAYDADTGTATVTLTADEDCDGTTVTFAGYELPGDDTRFVRANASGQELVGYETVTLGAGETVTLTVSTDV